MPDEFFRCLRIEGGLTPAWLRSSPPKALPMIAAAAMGFSSVTLPGNAQRSRQVRL
ncbi:MAG: hypothetical protein WBQ78_00525 [Gammaproteobacteria bacterium]